MAPHVFLTTIGLVFGAVVLIFAFKYASAAVQGRASAAREEAYIALAERAVKAQGDNTAMLSSIAADLTSIVARLHSVETILKQVE